VADICCRTMYIHSSCVTYSWEQTVKALHAPRGMSVRTVSPHKWGASP
jgi:hypothetical protein